MAKIIEYKVVFDMTLAPFMRLVNEAIADGWQPNGGFTCDRSRYYQAMVKYEEQSEPFSASDAFGKVLKNTTPLSEDDQKKRFFSR